MFDLGFFGGGQLARMSIQAAQRMGFACCSLDPSSASPASQVAERVVGSLSNPRAVFEIASRCQFLTLENEFILSQALREGLTLAQVNESRLTPSLQTLEIIQDKLAQRRLLSSAGVETPTAMVLEGQIEACEDRIGYPMVIKARFGGYDGKGTITLHSRGELEAARERWHRGGWLAERFVPFQRELAVMVCRSTDQETCFPTVETVQENHVCSLVFPCDTDASSVAMAAVRAIEGYGLFGVELFEEAGGRISVNEIAPRPHNTGHYSLDWGGPSQFEAHVRLATGLPLPFIPKSFERPICMANLLGLSDAGDWREAMRRTVQTHPNAMFHWYGKDEAKAGRKMGHINALDSTIREAKATATAARDTFYEHWKAAK